MIRVNNRDTEWKEGETVRDLLGRMNFVFPMIVVKIDGKVIPKTEFESTEIPDNSDIKMIHLISGG